MGFAIVCVQRNVQHRELKPPRSTRSSLITVIMAAVSTSGPTSCPVRLPHLSYQRIQSHEKNPASHRAQGETPTVCLALSTDPEGTDMVKGKASRMQSSRTGSALVCVHRNAQNCEPNLPVSTRCLVIIDMMVAVSIRPPPVSQQVLLPSHPKAYHHTKPPA